jgi:hypothetical protein
MRLTHGMLWLRLLLLQRSRRDPRRDGCFALPPQLFSFGQFLPLLLLGELLFRTSLIFALVLLALAFALLALRLFGAPALRVVWEYAACRWILTRRCCRYELWSPVDELKFAGSRNFSHSQRRDTIGLRSGYVSEVIANHGHLRRRRPV